MAQIRNTMSLLSDLIRPAGPVGSGRVRGIVSDLSQPVSLQSLAVFRIVFGLLMFWDVLRYARHGWIGSYYAAPDVFFSYDLFRWIRQVPEPWIHWLWGLIAVCSVCVALGLFYRLAIIAFTVLFAYFFLLDKTQYLNHFYLILIYAALLCVLPAQAMWSLDAWRGRRVARETGPYWVILVLRLQTEIILIFAGLVKLNSDWLNLQPLSFWLRNRTDAVPFGFLFEHDWVIALGAWGVVALHLIGAPLLLWQRTRLPVFLLYCVFHLTNARLFSIGVFPWMTIAATTVFFAPDWPRRLVLNLNRIVGVSGGTMRAVSVPAWKPGPVAARVFAGFFGVWFLLQIGLPLRAALYPGDVHWNGQGHRFSWRMKLLDRRARGEIFVVNETDGEMWWIDPGVYLTPHQEDMVMTRPDMLLQFAAMLEERWQADGYEDVAVYAEIEMSLNGRAWQPWTDGSVDLTKVPTGILASYDWILPLTTPLSERR